MELVTRKDAQARGLTRYFTGKPCKHGHIAERLSSDGKCCVCRRNLHKSWSDKNSEYCLEYRKKRDAGRREASREESREWRRKNKEKHTASVLEWRKANPEKVREYAKKASKNAAAKVRALRASDPSPFREYERLHRIKKPEVRKARDANRLARHRAAPGAGLSSVDISRMADEQLGLCCYCLRREPLTVDHVIPITKGGAHDSENCVMACRSCNASKGNRSLLMFLAGGSYLSASRRAA